MKKIDKLIISVISLITILSIVNPTNVVITESKKVKAGANSSNNLDSDNNVSTRELAMLASLVYEDVPDDANYEGDTAGRGCVINKQTGRIDTGCKFIALEGATASNVKRKGSKYPVWQYIEGLSERKMNSFVSKLTSAFQEDGQKYYFLNFADTTEMDDWSIVNYKAQSLKETGPDVGWDSEFYAITFKKENNYVIAYRGTDYPDLLEWLMDFAYAFNGEHDQANLAYEYAQAEYKRIVSENSNAKIYVTGHSLGAYLAQVGGAAIIDSVSGKTDPYRTPDEINTLEEYKNIYNPASNLKQVAYFNGMGVGGIFSTNSFSKNISNALVYLSTYDNDVLATNNRYVNYSTEKTKVKSSGKLVLYSMDSDPISSIGLHYGEIYKLDVAADAISNHYNKHDSKIPVGEALEWVGVSGDKLFENINNLARKIEEAEIKLKQKFIQSISENTYAIIKANSLEVNNKKTDFPIFVTNTISNENGGKDISKFNFISLLSNLADGITNFQKDKLTQNIKINSVIDHFNINHETDSFTCLVDKNNGYLTDKQIGLEISSDTMICEGTTCYTNRSYSVNGYEVGSNFFGNKEINNNIRLTAQVNSGCAKEYRWYYLGEDGKSKEHIGTTVINTIVIPDGYLDISANGSVSGYFQVEAIYGDKYHETKISLTDASLFKYSKTGKVTEVNPTITKNGVYDGVTDTKGTASSAANKITLVYDTEAPTCSFATDTMNVTLERGGFLNLGVEPKNIKVLLTCTDKLSGFSSNNNNVGFGNFSLDKNTGIGTDIAEYTNGSSIETKVNQNTTMQVKVPITILRKPTLYTAELKYKGTITDRAGNKASKKDTVRFNIEKAAR